MWGRILVFGALLLCAGASQASATVRITSDNGGQIQKYLNRYTGLRNSGEQVVIDGPCLSACTLILGIVPNKQVCVTRRARLGFHAAWTPGQDGSQVRSDRGVFQLMQWYPPKVRRWIARKGGLTRRIIYLKGGELTAFYPRCHQTN